MIICRIFQKQEPVINDITDKINAVKNVDEKAKFAEVLQKEVNVLLECEEYDSKNFDCKNCRTIASMRAHAAVLIIKAKKLAE